MLSPVPQLAATPAAISDPLEMMNVQRVKLNFIGMIGFFAMCALCTMNINYLTRAFAGVEQAFSVLYLVASLVVAFSFKFKARAALGQAGTFWIGSMLLFLLIATRFGMGIDRAYFMSPQSNLYRTLIAQYLVVCAAMGMRHMVLAGRGQLALRVLLGMCVLAVLTIVITKKAPWLLRFVGAGNQDRSGGFFSDPNRAGNACCVAAAIGFACLAGETTSKGKLFAYGCLLAIMPCLFMTYSRSSILLMGMLVVLQFFISPILRRKESLLAILVLAVGIAGGVGYILNKRGSLVNATDRANVEAQQERMESLFRILRGEFDHSDTGGRLYLAGVGLKHFASSPVIGVGYRKLSKMPEVGLGCHNTFLRVFGEAGFFSGMMYVGSVVFLAFCGWRSKFPQVKCLLIGYAAAYSGGCMVSHSMLTNRMHNIVLGVCLGLLSATITIQLQEARKRRAAERVTLQQTYAAIPQPAQPGLGAVPQATA